MRFPSGFSALLLTLTLAHGQTFFWHRDPALVSAGGISKSYNWTIGKDGLGARPASVSDDQFAGPALDTAWKFVDQDGSDSTGTYAFKDGKLVLSGRGEDFTQAKHFWTGVHRLDIKGNFDVTVRVDSQVASHDWSKAGILVADNMADFTQGGVALLALTPRQGVIFEWNSLAPIGNIDAIATSGASLVPPVWLRMAKNGEMVSAFYRTDSTTAWIPIGAAQSPLSTAVDSDIGLFVLAVDSVGKTVRTTAGAFDDFRGGGDIASSNLDLRFDGTGANHDVDVVLAGDFAARSLDFATYLGSLSFNAHALTLSAGARFSPSMAIHAGTGTLAFTGAAGPDTLALKANDTLPALLKSGAGRLVVQNGTLSAASLRIQGGVLDFSNNSADLGGLVSTGGALEGLGADDSLIVTGDADFSGLAAFNAPVGNVVIKSFGASSRLFNPGGKTFPRLTLWTWATTAKATLVVGPGSLATLGNLVFRNHLETSGFDGALDFGTHNPSVTLGGDLLQVKDGTGTNSQTLSLGSGTWTVPGNVGLSLEAGGSGSSAIFKLTKASGIQTLAVSNGSLHTVEHAAPGTLKLASALSATHLYQSAGSLDFGGFDLSLKGDLKVGNGGPLTLLNLAGRTLTVEGKASFVGQAPGPATGLGLNPSTSWRLKVSGALTADSSNIANCDASLFTKGIASQGSIDQKGNINWEFWTPPTPPTVIREPVDVLAKPGWKVTFTVGAQGSGPLAYAWKRAGDSIVLSSDTVLVLDSVPDSLNNTAYSCVVSNALGKDTTRPALLTVRACDSSFAPPADVAAVEGGKVVLVGKAGCAAEIFWSPVSGPVPKILDPQVDTLRFDVPRIKGDTALVLNFSARYGGNWESRNVTVTLKDGIPDPAASLDSMPAWNGAAPKVIRPRIGNAAALADFPTYPLRYLWALDPLIADSALAGDSLTLQGPREDGNMEVSVCVDNGGTPSCSKAVLEVKRVPVSVLIGKRRVGPVWLSGHALAWKEAGLARVMDWRGRILWERWGSPGSQARLPADAERSLRIGAARLDFLAKKKAR